MQGKKSGSTIRMEPALMKKLKYIANYNDRSVNKEITSIVRQYINAFEKKNGDIPIDGNEE